MTQQTIRRTATKQIDAMLKQAIVISRFFDDETDGHQGSWSATAAEVMEVGQRVGFRKVYSNLDRDGEWETLNLIVHSAYSFTAYRNQDVAKRLMTNASWAHHFPEAYQAEQEAAQREAEESSKAFYARWNGWHALRVSQEPQIELKVGQRIRAVFAVVNKRSSLADYIGDCLQPEFGEPEWDQRTLSYVSRPNWRSEQCEVQSIIVLSESDYDELAISLTEPRPTLFAEMGGTKSDWKGPDVEPYQLEGEDKENWIAQSYRLVVVIRAPGRLTFVVDPQGYLSARYVGIKPTLISES